MWKLNLLCAKASRLHYYFLGIHLKSSPITITQHGMLSHFWIWDGWMINLVMTWESFNFLGLKTLLVSEVFTDYVIVSLYFQ